jgi:hypothetical protein
MAAQTTDQEAEMKRLTDILTILAPGRETA